MTKLLKTISNYHDDNELKKTIEQVQRESMTRNEKEKESYFNSLFKRQHENNAKRGKK